MVLFGLNQYSGCSDLDDMLKRSASEQKPFIDASNLVYLEALRDDASPLICGFHKLTILRIATILADLAPMLHECDLTWLDVVSRARENACVDRWRVYRVLYRSQHRNIVKMLGGARVARRHIFALGLTDRGAKLICAMMRESTD